MLKNLSCLLKQLVSSNARGLDSTIVSYQTQKLFVQIWFINSSFFKDKINHTHSYIIFIVAKPPILEIETAIGFFPRTVPSKEQKQI